MNVSIRYRLLGGFSLLGIITLALGLWAILQITLLARMEARTYDRPLMAIAYIHAAATRFEQLANPTLARRLAAEKAAGDDPVAALFGDLHVARTRASSAKAVALVDLAKRRARRWLNNPLKENAEAVRVAFEDAAEQIMDDGFLDRAAAAEAERRARYYGTLASIGAFILSALLSLVLSQRFVRPIRAATDLADRIASGNLTVPIDRHRRDEIGTLMSALGVMQQRIRSMLDAERSHAAKVEQRLSAMLRGSVEAMILLDQDEKLIDANPRGRGILELFTPGWAAGDDFVALFADRAWAERMMGGREFFLPDGRWLAPARHDLATGGSFLVLADVTIRKEYEAKLATVAYRDQLTGLGNRSFMLERLDRIGPIGSTTVLILANIDRFRQLNNIYGSHAGDAVLRDIAGRLAARVPEGDLCARMNGDEFAIVCVDASAEQLAGLLASLAEDFVAPVANGDSVITVSVRMGVAKAGEAPQSQLLFNEARAALDNARRMGPGAIAQYDSRLRDAARIRDVIDRDLPEAIASASIDLHYQPLVSLTSGATIGVEALARWRHPELGNVSPLKFVGAAEESGLIVPLGALLLQKAAASAQNWSALTPEGFTVAINLSPRQLIDRRAAHGIIAFLEENSAIAPFLKFEVTESLLIEEPAAMIPVLQALKARGAKLALDDFGTGFSSLAYLHRFPFDVLKIDQSFVKHMDRDADALRLIRTIIELGRDLGLQLVAEGVETGAHATMLRELGAHIAQGYLFAKPMEGQLIPGFVADRAPPVQLPLLQSAEDSASR